MSSAKIYIEGDKELQRKLEAIEKKAPSMLSGILFMGSEATRSEAVTSINAHKSAGRTYQRGNVSHTASSAGNPPNTDTGQLVQNITTEEIQGGYDVGSRSGAPYGAWLEFGTLKISPRPWLLPAYNIAVKKVNDALKKIKLT